MFPFPNATESDDPLHPLFFKSPTNFHLPNDLNPTFDDKYYNHFFSCFPNSPLFDDHDLPLNQILPNNLLMNSSDQPQPQARGQAQPRDSDGAGVKKETPTKRGLGASSKMKGKAGDDQMMTTTVAAPPSRRRGVGAVPRRRTGKKDRHSKISTAQGIRDRRMRLSLQIARKFFDLQDMLGYDKASKTIEWLFSKSKKAIKDLIKENNPQGNSISMSDGKSESFVSECEVMSGIDQENSNSEVKEGTFPDNETFLLSSNINDVKDERKSRTKTVSKPNMRESREKARARARCRTREKLMNKGVDQSSTPWQKSSPNCNDVQKLGSSTNPFESGVVVDHQAESGSINQERVSSYGADYTSTTSFGQQMADVGTIEKLLGTSASSSTSCPISDYYCSAAVPCCIDPSSSFMGFLGNWDLLNNDRDNISATVQVSLPNSEYSSPVNNNTPNFTFYHQ